MLWDCQSYYSFQLDDKKVIHSWYALIEEYNLKLFENIVANFIKVQQNPIIIILFHILMDLVKLFYILNYLSYSVEIVVSTIVAAISIWFSPDLVQTYGETIVRAIHLSI